MPKGKVIMHIADGELRTGAPPRPGALDMRFAELLMPSSYVTREMFPPITSRLAEPLVLPAWLMGGPAKS